MSDPPLPMRRTGIPWATSHIASVFSIACAFMILVASFKSSVWQNATFMLAAIAVANLSASTLVPKGRHPGWIALLAVTALTGVASSID